MTDVAKKRKREEGKETVLTYGGRVYTKEQAASTLARSKRLRVDRDAEAAGMSFDDRIIQFALGCWSLIPSALLHRPCNPFGGRISHS